MLSICWRERKGKPWYWDRLNCDVIFTHGDSPLRLVTLRRFYVFTWTGDRIRLSQVMLLGMPEIRGLFRKGRWWRAGTALENRPFGLEEGPSYKLFFTLLRVTSDARPESSMSTVWSASSLRSLSSAAGFQTMIILITVLLKSFCSSLTFISSGSLSGWPVLPVLMEGFWSPWSPFSFQTQVHDEWCPCPCF